MTIKMAAMTRTRTDINDKFSVIFSHGIRSIPTLQDHQVKQVFFTVLKEVQQKNESLSKQGDW